MYGDSPLLQSYSSARNDPAKARGESGAQYAARFVWGIPEYDVVTAY